MTDKQPDQSAIVEAEGGLSPTMPSKQWIWCAASICRGSDPTAAYLRGFITAIQFRQNQTEAELWNDRQTLAAFAAGYEKALTDGEDAIGIAVSEHTEKAIAKIEAHAKALLGEHAADVFDEPLTTLIKPTLN